MRFSVAHATHKSFQSTNLLTVKNVPVPGSKSTSPIPAKICMLQFLYEIITHLPENQSQIWLLDELRRFIHKLRQYRHLLSKLQSQDLFFSRVQIWNKSVTETREKFLALYQIHLTNQCGLTRSNETRRTEHSLRLEVLSEIFIDYHARQLNLIDITTMCTSGWSSVQVQQLLSFLVQTCSLHDTCEMPELVVQLCDFLNQTGPSIWRKLQSIQKEYQDQLTKTLSLQASEISIYFEDPQAQLRQILVADWNNAKDIWATGIRCIRRLCLEYPAARRKRNGKQLSPLHNTTQVSPIMTSSSNELTMQKAPSPGHDYSGLLHAISRETDWRSQLTYRVCKAMSQHVSLFQAHRYTAFYNEVTKAVPEIERFELILKGNLILSKIMTQHDFLDHFGNRAPQHVLKEVVESFAGLNHDDSSATSASRLICESSQVDENGHCCDKSGPCASHCDIHALGSRARNVPKRNQLKRRCQSHQNSTELTTRPLENQRCRYVSQSPEPEQAAEDHTLACTTVIPGEISNGPQDSTIVGNGIQGEDRNQRKHIGYLEQLWMDLIEPVEQDTALLMQENAKYQQKIFRWLLLFGLATLLGKQYTKYSPKWQSKSNENDGIGLGTRPGEIYNARVGEFNVELQIMWSFHCETKLWTTHKHWLKYLHLIRNKEFVVVTWTELTDHILEIKQEWESNQALRHFDPRRVYWENHFRQQVSRSHRNTFRDSEGIIDELDRFYENTITLVKLNSRDIDDYTLERIVRLKALQKIDLHHPPNRDRFLQDSNQTTIWSLFLQLLQRQRMVNQLGFYHGKLQNAQLIDLSIALSSRVEKFGPTAEISRFELVSIKLADDCLSNGAPLHCVTESNVVSTLCATIAKLQFLENLRISNSLFTCEGTDMEKVTAELLYTAFHLPRLKSLCLEHADMPDNVFKKALRSLLFPATTSLCSITTIHFGDNCITAQTLRMLGLIISTKGWKLKRLDLQGSMNIGDSGIPCLIPILADSGLCVLEDLNLRNCGLGIDGARMLCTALETNQSVQRMNISHNFLSPVFGGSLASLLQHNTTINALHCDYIGLTDVGCTDELILAIQNNLALNEITLGVNRLGDNGSSKVFDALVKRSLRKPYIKIDLSGNIITSLGLHRMQLALRQQIQSDSELMDQLQYTRFELIIGATYRVLLKHNTVPANPLVLWCFKGTTVFISVAWKMSSEDDDMTYLLGPKMHIRNIFLTGNDRTRAELFDRELADAIEAEYIGQIFGSLEQSLRELTALDIFTSIDVKLDKGMECRDDEVDVYINVKEKSWRKIKIGATTDGSEETAETSCTLTNAFGNAERLTLSASYGRTGSNTEAATLVQPRFMGLPLTLSINATNELHTHEAFSSYSEKVRGALVALCDEFGRHELSLHCGWRDIIPKRDKTIPTIFHASPSILAQAQPSVKTSVKYSFNDDDRDDPMLPCFGSLLHCSTEIAGLYGDVKFVKTEVSAQKHTSFGPTMFQLPLLNFSLSSRFGLLKTVRDNQEQDSRISDRFFLGGPLSLRGFHYKGVGPRASPTQGGVPSGDSLGGDLFYTASAHVGFPFPFPMLAMLGLRGQVFGSIGNLTTWDRVLHKKRWMRNLANDTRVSIGMGLVLPSSFGRLEASYSWIISALKHDHIRRGQIGIGSRQRRYLAYMTSHPACQ
uniref:Sorting and assembly machinery component 50 putativ n=1 Tax=Albugo laibachii Nc14 TaxID=890382 RepID=F0W4E0_9STRA|nr:sorting and assembly machinery component 50 putativ [Albugo laibachii Nc14]|eukprot:CCA15973.1 sorting and assembly machinery component 50 putativ [Albugo laibachii Nc14]